MGADEVGEVATELVVALVVVSLNDGVPEGAVHSLDLTIGSRMSRPGRTMIDVVLGADVLERVRPEVLAGIHGDPDLGGRVDVSWCCEVGAVVGQHDGVDLVGHGHSEGPEDVAGDLGQTGSAARDR